MGGRNLYYRAYFGGGSSINVYQELWALLRPHETGAPTAVSGVLTSLSPLAVSVRGEVLSQGLLAAADLALEEQDLGRTVALLPMEEGLLLLCPIREVNP